MNLRRKICGLQLHFNNGVSSPRFETEIEQPIKKDEKVKKWKLALLDPADEIGSIETYVNEEEGKFSIVAIRFRDRYGVCMQVITLERPLDDSACVKGMVEEG